MEKIFIFGAGGHSKVIIDIVEAEGKYKIEGLIDKQFSNEDLYGYKLLGSEEDLNDLCNIHGVNKGFIAIGDNQLRKKVAKQIKNIVPGFSFISLVHPKSYISKFSEIGDGTVIMPGAIINASSKVGNHCIINTGSIIEHDCKLNDYASIAPGSKLAGSVSIGKCSQIGIGAIISNNVTIGKYCVIGASSYVRKNTLDNAMYYGSPAKLIEKIK